MISPLFERQLSRLDSTLYTKMDRRIERFVVYRRDRKSKPRDILAIEDDCGQFCYPNSKHIAKLYAMDSWQNKHIIKEMDAYNDHLSDEADARLRLLHREMSLLITRSKHY